MRWPLTTRPRPEPTRYDQSGTRALDHSLVENDSLVLRQVTSCPTDAVFGVEFGGKDLTSEWTVDLLLEEPGRVLTISIELDLEVAMAQDVVDGTEAVKGAAHIVLHERMTTITIAGHRSDSKHTIT